MNTQNTEMLEGQKALLGFCGKPKTFLLHSLRSTSYRTLNQCPLALKYRSASKAAIHPVPAAVTACR